VALAAWPFFGSGSRAVAVRPAAATVLPDYLYRDRTIAFYEMRVRRDPQDQISAKTLAQQYLQRFREAGDIDDVKRSMLAARRAIALQPGNNWSSYEALASAESALHLFRQAFAHERFALADRSDDPNGIGQMASTEMELGRYEDAGRLIGRALEKHPRDPGLLAVRARYEELSGHLKEARVDLARGAESVDSVSDNSAQSRAWYHYRAGEMAFSAGAVDEAERDERDALVTFPEFAQAYNSLARSCWATKDWRCALAAATKGAEIAPLPETLGYKADAERALGDAAAARRTDDLIVAIERIGNAYRVSDRLLAVYYSEHGIRLDDALRIARRETMVRGTEIYAQDTLAWAAAMDGHWTEARAASRLALRWGTEDSRLHYHAGIIALHFGDRAEAIRQLSRALESNPRFHPRYADDATRRLAVLRSRGLDVAR